MNEHLKNSLLLFSKDLQRLKILYPLKTALSWNCSRLIYKQILRSLVLYDAPNLPYLGKLCQNPHK